LKNNISYPGRRVVLCVFLLIPLVMISAQTFGSESCTQAEKRLLQDMEDHFLHDHALIEAACILSGVTDPDSIQHYLDWYSTLLKTIEAFHFDPMDRIGSANKVFNYLHGTWLQKYQLEATTLTDIKNVKKFNCVSATVLFNLICEDLGWPTEAFETPSHVYTIFPNFTEPFRIENTSPIGFNIMKNLQAYSRYLAQFYPENQVLHIGLDRLYLYENSKGRLISNTELLGLLAYNRAYFALKQSQYLKAGDLVRLARRFNYDSRSNIAFEIGLYSQWSRFLFEKKQYNKAFQVLSEAVLRYPDEQAFSVNCRSAFQNALRACWIKKNWPATRYLLNSMLDLDILSEQDFDHLIDRLAEWEHYLNTQQRMQESKEAALYIKRLYTIIPAPQM